MDEIASKVLIIAISIFVTLLIVTVVILEFDQIKKIYSGVAETDISFEGNLDELNKYRDPNNKFSGLDVKNTINKYKYNSGIEVYVDGTICNDATTITEDKYTEKYTSTLDESGNVYKIKFSQEQK